MINIYSNNKISKEIVQKALLRSFGLTFSNINFFINPSNIEDKIIKELIQKNSKILVFGKISNELSSMLGLNIQDCKLDIEEIVYDHNNFEDTSRYKIKYETDLFNALSERYFHRFDFMNEWNNLGYGQITLDNSIWSLSNVVEKIDCKVLSKVYDKENVISIFSSIKDFVKSSVLYINREVATVDGLDWVVIEEFINSYRNSELPSLPLIKDIPYGYKSITSSRLDCDQSIINSKPLVELYKKYDIDISLAISTGINITQEEIDFLNDFYDSGGGVLSHTTNHHYYWGENYNIAYEEAYESKKWLENNIKNLSQLKYAVSPFHSNKPYSVQALKDSEYDGFISGIIHNDPEYLISTSGEVPFVDGKIVSHSQQCMLHGDCYHRRNNSIEIEKESFKNHYNSGKVFGYLDHPFGGYHYGWNSEDERLNVHEEFINYINTFDGVKWMTCTKILNFVIDKSNLEIEINENDELKLNRKTNYSNEKIEVIFKGKSYIC